MRLLIQAVLVLVVAAGSPVRGQSSDLDALMKQVLENRETSWRQLQDFLLSERERLSLVGPDLTPLFGFEREYVWVARNGVAVRSVQKANGVAVSPDETGEPHEEATLGKFMRFPFEPGNYYLAGREVIDGVEVLRIEYYPTRLFDDEDGPADADESRLDVAFNKVSQVTLWVDPARQQIVRAVFENVDFSFLPGRFLVRVESARATLEMGQPFSGVWLPARSGIEGAVTLATGTHRVTYERTYFDYRRADVRVRFKVGPP